MTMIPLRIPKLRSKCVGISSLSLSAPITSIKTTTTTTTTTTTIDDLFADLKEEYNFDKERRKTEIMICQKSVRDMMTLIDEEENVRLKLSVRQREHFSIVKLYFNTRRCNISLSSTNSKSQLKHSTVGNKFFATHLAKGAEITRRRKHVHQLYSVVSQINYYKQTKKNICITSPSHNNFVNNNSKQCFATDSETTTESNCDTSVVIRSLDVLLFPKKTKIASEEGRNRLFLSKCSGITAANEPYAYAEKLFFKKFKLKREDERLRLINKEQGCRDKQLEEENDERKKLILVKQHRVDYIRYLHESSETIPLKLTSLILHEKTLRKRIADDQKNKITTQSELFISECQDIIRNNKEMEEGKKRNRRNRFLFIGGTHAAQTSSYLTTSQLKKIAASEVDLLEPDELSRQLRIIESLEFKERSLLSSDAHIKQLSILKLCSAITCHSINEQLTELVLQQHEHRRALSRYQRKCFEILSKNINIEIYQKLSR